MPYIGKKPADIIATAVDTTTGTFSGEVDAASLDISGNIDVDGTTNLDVVDIDGAVDMASTLQVDGAITSSVGATITVADNSDNLTLTSTDADANVAPNLRLYRNSGSPADSDQIGKIQFEGKNDAGEDVVYSEIVNQIKDVTDGTEDGRMAFNVIFGGTAYSRIDMQATETVINNESQDLDFRVEGNGNANALFVNGETDEVGIKTATLFGDGLTITPSVANSTLSTCLVLSSGANSTTGSGARMILTGCTNDPLARAVVLEGKHEGNNNSISFRVYTSSDNSPVEHFRVSSNGTLTATDTSIGSNSDSRLKKDIKDYTYDIDKFKLYTPKTFEWINKEVHGNKENNRGFLAQDIKDIDDRWVGTTDVQEDTADYDIISDNMSLTSKLGEKDAMYISVIKQLIDRIETLEAKVTTLENA